MPVRTAANMHDVVAFPDSLLCCNVVIARLTIDCRVIVPSMTLPACLRDCSEHDTASLPA
jgi:hypothetical protein